MSAFFTQTLGAAIGMLLFIPLFEYLARKLTRLPTHVTQSIGAVVAVALAIIAYTYNALNGNFSQWESPFFSYSTGAFWALILLRLVYYKA